MPDLQASTTSCAFANNEDRFPSHLPLQYHLPHLAANVLPQNSSRRRKCHTPEFGTSCTYCVDRGIQCTRSSLPPRPRPPDVPKQLAPAIEQTAARSSPQTVELPPISVCVELTHLYFDLIHDQFHSLFHRPSVIRDVEEGKAPPVILFAMMALSAR
jgi:hypothetical protein